VIKSRFLPAAEFEFLHEVTYYSKIRLELGERFHDAVKAAVSRVVRFPFSGAPSYKGTRSAMLKGFPFSMVYRTSADEILVVAIAPHRKRPNYWASRVE
jgi:hypothetical protein